jgi:hypothetical protein
MTDCCSNPPSQPDLLTLRLEYPDSKTSVADPVFLSRILIFPSRIKGKKKIADPGSASKNFKFF